jgi:hypothetical protein
MPAPDAPLVDQSDPCSGDLSRLPQKPSACLTGSRLTPGATGVLPKPSTGSWSVTLNATNGEPGGGSGSSFIAADPDPDEWGR